MLKPRPPRRTHSNESEPLAPSSELVQETQRDTRTGRSEGMTYRNRAPGHIETIHVHLSQRFRAPRPFSSERCRLEGLEHGENLCGKGFVKIDQVHVAEGESGPTKRGRSAQGRTNQELIERIDTAEGIGPNVAERAVAQGLGLLFGHEQHGRRTIGKWAGVARGKASIAAIEHRA